MGAKDFVKNISVWNKDIKSSYKKNTEFRFAYNHVEWRIYWGAEGVLNLLQFDVAFGKSFGNEKNAFKIYMYILILKLVFHNNPYLCIWNRHPVFHFLLS